MTIISAYTSTKRIQGYLQGEEKTSHRGMTTTSCPDIQKREKDEVEIILEGRFGIQEVTLLDFRSKVQIPIGRLTCVQGRSYLCYTGGWSSTVSGSTGDGKTNMLKALLGELDQLSGSRMSDLSWASLGYCCQTPWLQTSRSIKDNILFYSSYDSRWYEEVISACDLRQDLSALSDGDAQSATGLVSWFLCTIAYSHQLPSPVVNKPESLSPEQSTVNQLSCYLMILSRLSTGRLWLASSSDSSVLPVYSLREQPPLCWFRTILKSSVEHRTSLHSATVIWSIKARRIWRLVQLHCPVLHNRKPQSVKAIKRKTMTSAPRKDSMRRHH